MDLRSPVAGLGTSSLIAGASICTDLHLFAQGVGQTLAELVSEGCPGWTADHR